MSKLKPLELVPCHPMIGRRVAQKRRRLPTEEDADSDFDVDSAVADDGESGSDSGSDSGSGSGSDSGSGSGSDSDSGRDSPVSMSPPLRRRRVRIRSAQRKKLGEVQQVQFDPYAMSPGGASPQVVAGTGGAPVSLTDGILRKDLVEQNQALQALIGAQTEQIAKLSAALEDATAPPTYAPGRRGGKGSTGAVADGKCANEDEKLLQRTDPVLFAQRFEKNWKTVMAGTAPSIETLPTIGVNECVATKVCEYVRGLTLSVACRTVMTCMKALGLKGERWDGIATAMAGLGASIRLPGDINLVTGMILAGPPGTGKTFLMHSIAAHLKRTFGLLIPNVWSLTRGDMRTTYNGQQEADVSALFCAANTKPVDVTLGDVVSFLVEMGGCEEMLRDAAAAVATAPSTAAPSTAAPPTAAPSTARCGDWETHSVRLPMSIGIIFVDECDAFFMDTIVENGGSDAAIEATTKSKMGTNLGNPDTTVFVIGTTNHIGEVNSATKSRLSRIITVERPDGDAVVTVMDNVFKSIIPDWEGFPDDDARSAVLGAASSRGNDIRVIRAMAESIKSRRLTTADGVEKGFTALQELLSVVLRKESSATPPVSTIHTMKVLPSSEDYIEVSKMFHEDKPPPRRVLDFDFGGDDDDDE